LLIERKAKREEEREKSVELCLNLHELINFIDTKRLTRLQKITDIFLHKRKTTKKKQKSMKNKKTSESLKISMELYHHHKC
jgi:hypothetical protein